RLTNVDAVHFCVFAIVSSVQFLEPARGPVVRSKRPHPEKRAYFPRISRENRAEVRQLRFETRLESDQEAVFIRLPDDVVAALGTGSGCPSRSRSMAIPIAARSPSTVVATTFRCAKRSERQPGLRWGTS